MSFISMAALLAGLPVLSTPQAPASQDLAQTPFGDPVPQAPPAPDLAQTPFDAPAPSFHWGDFDGDALVDVAVVSAGGELRLLANRGDGGFADVTVEAGLEGVSAARFVLWQDYDADGRADLFVGTAAGRSRLFQNQGGGVLSDIAETAGIRHVGDDRRAQWLDYDRDGRQDLHVETAAGDVLYHALASGSFEEVALELPASFFTVASTGAAAAGAAPEEGVAAGQAAATSTGSSTFVTNVLVSDESDSARRPVATGGGSEPSVVGASRVPTVPAIGSCAGSIRDQARLGTCLEASSAPLFGTLYPLGPEFSIDPAGRVGIGNVAPTKTLDVAGDFGVRGNLDLDVMFENTGSGQTVVASHTGSGSPNAFEFVEDSTSINNLNNYGMFNITRRNVSTDGAGSSLYFEMSDFGGFDREMTGIGARVDAGLSAAVPVDASLHFYTTDNGSSRQDHLTLTAEGNLEQDVANAGLAKAGCHVAGGVAPTISRRFNHLRSSGGAVTVTRLSAGTYIVSFGVNVASRFYQVSLGNAATGVPLKGGISATPAFADPNGVFVETYDVNGVLTDTSFFLLIY